MNLIGEKVINQKFGIGTVVSVDDKYISVEFSTGKKDFQFPSAFTKYIVAENKIVQEAIVAEINKKEAEEEAKRIAAEKEKEIKRKAEEDRRKINYSKDYHQEKTYEPVKRVEGQRKIFFVFQGGTLDAEYKGGFIWAPKFDSSGGTHHFWDRLLDVREGDIIIHGANQEIVAISLAKAPCYDAFKPESLDDGQTWDREGRRVDCTCTLIKKAVRYSDYKDINKSYSNVKYAPFDRNGNGVQGYLFEMNREHAVFFIEESVKQNKYLLDLDYVRELLENYKK